MPVRIAEAAGWACWALPLLLGLLLRLLMLLLRLLLGSACPQLLLVGVEALTRRCVLEAIWPVGVQARRELLGGGGVRQRPSLAVVSAVTAAVVGPRAFGVAGLEGVFAGSGDGGLSLCPRVRVHALRTHTEGRCVFGRDMLS